MREMRMIGPLFHAAFHGYTEFARMPLNRGVVVDARSVFGSTSLHAAAREKEVRAMRLLLEHGTDVNRAWIPRGSQRCCKK